MNTFGTRYRLTTFGESHGEAIGGVIDGCPAGFALDFDQIQKELDRRRPGQSYLTTSRPEPDRVEFLSGIFEGKTTGAPIGFIVRNTQARSSDYANLADAFRPSHADYTYYIKYKHRDYRGGGRASARETISRVVAGAIAKQILCQHGIRITAYTSQVGDLRVTEPYTALNFDEIEKTPVRCPDPALSQEMIALIKAVKAEGDTIGGVVSCVAQGVPAGLGRPLFGKLGAELAQAMMSIPAAKGFDYGMGFEGVRHRGSEVNDLFYAENGAIRTRTNYSGGIQGGISNGEDIYFRVAFKPVATLLREQATVNKDGKPVMLQVKGRHDPCVLPRAVPVVEAMTAIVLLDEILMH
jgi:chorismate synthase